MDNGELPLAQARAGKVLSDDVRDDRIAYLFRKLDPAGADAWAANALQDYLRTWRAGAPG